MYKYLIRPLLFRFKPETAHKLIFSLLGLLEHIPFGRKITKLLYKKESPLLKKEFFGYTFKNPVGLAAGLDKNGTHYNQLSDFGFSFIEIGSLTPEPQPGNPTPRLFRLPNDRAIINRMGINNLGIKHAIKHIQHNKPNCILSASIAKNTTSETEEEIIRDYETAFSLMYDFVDMFAINISCPNVEDLDSLQDISKLSEVIDNLLELRLCYEEYKPILLKLSPDIKEVQLDQILHYSMMSGIDGIIAGNTTRTRDGLTASKEDIESIGNGGLSGAPLFEKSLKLVKSINEKTKGRLPIIGVGGIMGPNEAKQMLDAGASLIQIYTGFIYEGPSIVKKINTALSKEVQKKK